MQLQFNVLDESVIKFLRRHPAKAKRHLNRALDRASLEVQRTAQHKVPKVFSTLWTSINVSTPRPFVRMIQPGVAYGKYVEMGTRPGYYPNVNALKPWINQMAGRGLSEEELDSRAFGLARHIHRHGTKAQPFMKPAFEEAERSSLLMKHIQAAISLAMKEG